MYIDNILNINYQSIIEYNKMQKFQQTINRSRKLPKVHLLLTAINLKKSLACFAVFHPLTQSVIFNQYSCLNLVCNRDSFANLGLDLGNPTKTRQQLIAIIIQNYYLNKNVVINGEVFEIIDRNNPETFHEKFYEITVWLINKYNEFFETQIFDDLKLVLDFERDISPFLGKFNVDYPRTYVQANISKLLSEDGIRSFLGSRKYRQSFKLHCLNQILVTISKYPYMVNAAENRSGYSNVLAGFLTCNSNGLIDFSNPLSFLIFNILVKFKPYRAFDLVANGLAKKGDRQIHLIRESTGKVKQITLPHKDFVTRVMNIFINAGFLTDDVAKVFLRTINPLTFCYLGDEERVAFEHKRSETYFNLLTIILNQQKHKLNDIAALLNACGDKFIPTKKNFPVLLQAVKDNILTPGIFLTLLSCNQEDYRKLIFYINAIKNGTLNSGSSFGFYKQLLANYKTLIESIQPDTSLAALAIVELEDIIFQSFGITQKTPFISGSNPHDCLEAGVNLSQQIIDEKGTLKLPAGGLSIQTTCTEIILSSAINPELANSLNKVEKIMKGFEKEQQSFAEKEAFEQSGRLDGEYEHHFNIRKRLAEIFFVNFNEHKSEFYSRFASQIKYSLEAILELIIELNAEMWTGYYNESENKEFANLKHLIETALKNNFTTTELSLGSKALLKPTNVRLVRANPKLALVSRLSINICTAKPQNSRPFKPNFNLLWIVSDTKPTLFYGEVELISETIGGIDYLIVSSLNPTSKFIKQNPNLDYNSFLLNILKEIFNVAKLNNANLAIIPNEDIFTNRSVFLPCLNDIVIVNKSPIVDLQTEHPLVVCTSPEYSTDCIAVIEPKIFENK